MLEIIHTDILSKISPIEKTVVLHGCNCFHTMNAGTAKYLVNQFPEILTIDRMTPFGDKNKLGTYSKVQIHPSLFILNCYIQFKPRREEAVEYEAVRACLKLVKNNFSGWVIRSPKVGCTLAGEDWSTVEQIFEEELYDESVKIYEIKKIQNYLDT